MADWIVGGSLLLLGVVTLVWHKPLTEFFYQTEARSVRLLAVLVGVVEVAFGVALLVRM